VVSRTEGNIDDLLLTGGNKCLCCRPAVLTVMESVVITGIGTVMSHQF
jgi:hypothetical protein